MSCSRICRELLWLVRFGDFGPSSQPHLDHLATCSSCRDEVGFDRAMVEQLRFALAHRVEGANPSPMAWERILARAQAPEPARGAWLWSWSTAFVGRLRFATAMAGTGLALLLAINTQVVGLPGTQTSTDWEPAPLQQVPRVPRELSQLDQLVERNAAPASTTSSEPEVTLPRVLPIASSQGEPATDEPDDEAAPASQLRLIVRPMQTPEPRSASSDANTESEGSTWQLVPSQPGEPS